jgi:hypothetical protein
VPKFKPSFSDTLRISTLFGKIKLDSTTKFKLDSSTKFKPNISLSDMSQKSMSSEESESSIFTGTGGNGGDATLENPASSVLCFFSARQRRVGPARAPAARGLTAHAHLIEGSQLMLPGGAALLPPCIVVNVLHQGLE